jgi:hypothetical protein
VTSGNRRVQLYLDAVGHHEVAPDLDAAGTALLVWRWRAVPGGQLADTLERQPRLCPAADRKQLLEVPAVIARAPCFTFRPVDQADLDVIADRTFWQTGQRAQPVERESAGSGIGHIRRACFFRQSRRMSVSHFYDSTLRHINCQ